MDDDERVNSIGQNTIERQLLNIFLSFRIDIERNTRSRLTSQRTNRN